MSGGLLGFSFENCCNLSDALDDNIGLLFYHWTGEKKRKPIYFMHMACLALEEKRTAADASWWDIN